MKLSNRTGVVLWFAALAAAGPVLAQPRVRIVVRAGDAVPVGPAGALIGSIGSPTLAPGGVIAFVGQMVIGPGGVGVGNDTALWRLGAIVGPELLLREGTQAPGFPAGGLLAEMGAPVLDPTGGAAIWVRVNQVPGQIDSTNDRGIVVGLPGFPAWLQWRLGQLVVNPPPETISALDGFRDAPTCSGNLVTAFIGAVAGAPAGSSSLILSLDVSDDPVVVAQAGTQAAGIAPGGLFDGTFSPLVMDSIDSICFRAALRRGTGDVTDQNDSGIWLRLSNGQVLLRMRTGVPDVHIGGVALDSLGDPVVSDASEFAVRCVLRHGVGGVDGSNDIGLYSQCACGALREEVRKGNQAAGLPLGVVFADFSRPAINADGRVMFGATLSGPGVTVANETSIWWIERPIRYTLVAREGSAAPGAPASATFANFDYTASDFALMVNATAKLVFRGALSDGTHGIWSYDPDHGLSLVVLEGQTVDLGPRGARMVLAVGPLDASSAQAGRQAGMNDDGQILFRATIAGDNNQPVQALLIADINYHGPACLCDWNHVDGLNSQDFFDFLGSFFSADADFNHDGVTNSQDFFDFLTCFFAGCP